MCCHYLVQPVACTPASGWEKGPVENQVGLVRERFFTPRLRVKNLEQLNVWLLDKCVAYAKAHNHPEQADQTIWQIFEAERGNLVPYVGSFDGFHCVPASVSKTRTVRFDNNKYSVLSTAVAARSKSTPMPTGLSSSRMGRSSPNIGAALAETRRSMIPGIMCLSWRANPALFAMAPRSATG
jgi:hypothetical protein